MVFDVVRRRPSYPLPRCASTPSSSFKSQAPSGSLRSHTPTGKQESVSTLFSRSLPSRPLTDAERGSLPLGVPDLMASRMRHDATLAPSMLDLRMNRQNLLNEMKLHQGRIVSNQFALMRPRRKPTAQRPQELEVPGNHDPGHVKRLSVAIRQTLEDEEDPEFKQQQLRRSLSSAPPPPPSARKKSDVGISRRNTFITFEAEEEDEDAKEVPDIDPTADLDVQRLTKDAYTLEVFNSMEEAPGLGLQKGRIARALECLSYTLPSKDLIEESLGTLIPKTHKDGVERFNIEEFCVVVHAFETARKKELQGQFKKLDEDNSGTINVRELRHLLWDKGYTVSTEQVIEFFKEVDTDGSGQIDMEEFELALQFVSERHGFTKQEAEELYALFDRYDQDNSNEMTADELAGAMGWFGSPTTIKQAREVIARFDDDGNGRLCKPEFLVVMRARLEEEISRLRSLFAEFDVDGSGTLSTREIRELMMRLGYTLTDEVVEEAVLAIGRFTDPNDADLVFEDVHRLLQVIQKCEAFSKSETEELLAVYRQHDKRAQDELREFELSRALNWLGYPLSTSRRNQLWVQIDIDKTGSIDKQEFLKLMRLLREEENVGANRLLEQHQGNLHLDEWKLRDFLFKLGYAPDRKVVDWALSQSIDGNQDNMPDIIGVVHVLSYIRKAETEKLRRSAGLSHTQAEKVHSKWNSLDTLGRLGKLEDVHRALCDLCRVKQDSGSEEEAFLLNLIREYQGEDGHVNLNGMCWIVRRFGDMRSEESWHKEVQAVEELRFNPAQVAQFREAFVQADTDESGCLQDAEVLAVVQSLLHLDEGPLRDLAHDLEKHVLAMGFNDFDFPTFLRYIKSNVRYAKKMSEFFETTELDKV